MNFLVVISLRTKHHRMTSSIRTISVQWRLSLGFIDHIPEFPETRDTFNVVECGTMFHGLGNHCLVLACIFSIDKQLPQHRAQLDAMKNRDHPLVQQIREIYPKDGSMPDQSQCDRVFTAFQNFFGINIIRLESTDKVQPAHIDENGKHVHIFHHGVHYEGLAPVTNNIDSRIVWIENMGRMLGIPTNLRQRQPPNAVVFKQHPPPLPPKPSASSIISDAILAERLADEEQKILDEQMRSLKLAQQFEAEYKAQVQTDLVFAKCAADIKAKKSNDQERNLKLAQQLQAEYQALDLQFENDRKLALALANEN